MVLLTFQIKIHICYRIGGGGLKGLELAGTMDLQMRFLDARLRKYIDMGFTEGQSGIPDMYGKVSDDLKEQIVVGNVAMGGPINYMYIGPMDVRHSFNSLKIDDNSLELMEDFMKRRNTQRRMIYI